MKVKVKFADNGISMEEAFDKYSRQKFTVYDEYTEGRMSRETMAERNAEIRKRIEETKQFD